MLNDDSLTLHPGDKGEAAWAERDRLSILRAHNKRVPFDPDSLPVVNSFPPKPLVSGQELTWHYRNKLTGRVEQTLTYVSVWFDETSGLVWSQLSRTADPGSKLFPCG